MLRHSGVHKGGQLGEWNSIGQAGIAEGDFADVLLDREFAERFVEVEKDGEPALFLFDASKEGVPYSEVDFFILLVDIRSEPNLARLESKILERESELGDVARPRLGGVKRPAR